MKTFKQQFSIMCIVLVFTTLACALGNEATVESTLALSTIVATEPALPTPTLAITEQATDGSGIESAPDSATTIPPTTISPTDVPTDIPPATIPPTPIPPTATSISPTPVPPTATPVVLSSPPTNWDGLADWVVNTYRVSVPTSRVQTALQSAGWQTERGDLQAFDINGDGVVEWLMTLYSTGLPSYEPPTTMVPGQFWVVNNNGIVFVTDLSDQDWESAPAIITVADFTGDSVYEVVTASTSCGAHTCYQSYRMVSTQKGGWQNIVQPLDLPTFDNQLINISYSEASTLDYSGNGVFDFLVHGGTIGSAGAGIHRGYTEVWGWNGEWMTRIGFYWDESNYRHHRLYDANEAFDNGDYALATELYNSVVEDDLEDVFDWNNPERTIYDDARIFSGFRLTLIALTQDDVDSANDWDSWLRLVYPGRILTDAASFLIQDWLLSDDLVSACSVVDTLIAPYENVTGGIAYLGYGNPEIPNEAVCPIR